MGPNNFQTPFIHEDLFFVYICETIEKRKSSSRQYFYVKIIEQKEEAQRTTIVHLSTSFWNGTHADNDLPEKDKLARGGWELASNQISLNFIQQLLSQPIRGLGRYLAFPIRPEKHKIGRWTLRSCFLSSLVEFCSEISEEKSKMSQQIRGQGGHLVFLIGPKKYKLGRGRGLWDLVSCPVLLNSIQRFQRRIWKCEKLTQRTDKPSGSGCTKNELLRISNLVNLFKTCPTQKKRSCQK